MYTSDTVVVVEPFIRQPDGDDVIIGRAETGVFLAISPEAVEVLDNLARGRSVGEAVALYHQKHGEAPDLDEFLELLETKGIVKPYGRNESGGTRDRMPLAQIRRMHYHFGNFPQSIAQQLFSRPALMFYLIVVALALT